jgi:hypothetical protein
MYFKLTESANDQIMMIFAERNKKKNPNLCVDKAYHSKKIEQEIVKRRYIPHM